MQRKNAFGNHKLTRMWATIKRMIMQFIVIASGVSSFVERKIRRYCCVVHVMGNFKNFITSIISPFKRLYFRVGSFKQISLPVYGLLWLPYVIGQTIIFSCCFFFFLSFFSSPNLSGRRLDVYHISAHGVALVQI